MKKITSKTEQIIHEAYLKNKDRIDDFSTDKKYGSDRKLPNPERTFRDTVVSYMSDEYKKIAKRSSNMSVNAAINATLNSAKYSTAEESSNRGVLKGIRGDRQAYEEWRRLTQHRKIDFSKLRYESDNKFIYSMPKYDILISFENSPVEVGVERIEKPSI